MAMILGPIIIPELYREISAIVLTFVAYRSVCFVFVDIKVMIDNFKILKKAQDSDSKKDEVPLGLVTEEIYHAFIIPSYKEDIELIAETLTILTKHKRAQSTYLVYLAMEKHEVGSE